jgi:predicted nucleic acid-binding protein
MKEATAICDAGPLMALAKLGVLSKVFSVYPILTISETVYQEAVVAGLAIGARDAEEIDNFCQSKKIAIFPSNEIKEVSLDMSSELHQGELETIKISLRLSADYVFIDDFDARRVAEENFQKMSANKTIKGTLGILVELDQKKLISKSQLKEYLEEIMRRKDIWISSKLCQKLIEALDAEAL